MITPLRSVVVVALGSYVASPADPLRVIRAAPTNEAEAGAVVTVVFDRPIAAGLAGRARGGGHLAADAGPAAGAAEG